jgi:hypothetical protein
LVITLCYGGCNNRPIAMHLFSKEKALYLADNPTKLGFSWLFLFAGIIAGYLVHKHIGDSRFIIMVVEKYVFISVALIFGLTRRLIERRLKSSRVAKDSWEIYLILPGGYSFIFFSALWFSHMILGHDVL